MNAMKTIRIDREVWAALQRMSTEPLTDTPNRVLRRLLKLDKPEQVAS